LDGNVVRWYFANVLPGSHYVTLQVRVNVTQNTTLTNWAHLNYTSLHGVKFPGSSASATTNAVPEGSWHYLLLGFLVLVTVNALRKNYGGGKYDKKTGS
ncbi:MAG: hypothetical protein N3F63_06950, partial [Thermoplasmata archaeon]|nr:hypothetical protein [Thermoplasmata archaeon]